MGGGAMTYRIRQIIVNRQGDIQILNVLFVNVSLQDLTPLGFLRIPVVSAQRPSVMKDNRLTGTPVLVIDSNISATFFANVNIIHFLPPPP